MPHIGRTTPRHVVHVRDAFAVLFTLIRVALRSLLFLRLSSLTTTHVPRAHADAGTPCGVDETEPCVRLLLDELNAFGTCGCPRYNSVRAPLSSSTSRDRHAQFAHRWRHVAGHVRGEPCAKGEADHAEKAERPVRLHEGCERHVAN